MANQQLFETEPARLMMAFASMCQEHKKYGEFYNYEDFAKTKFLKKEGLRLISPT